MNPFNVFGTQPEEYQLVVVLQNDQASWFRWRGQELMGSFREAVNAESLSRQALCPWLHHDGGAAECRVRLVLDTCLDEVDRVKVDGLSEGWSRAIQRRRMARRLHVDYPVSSIHLLPEYALPDVLSIVHNLIPPVWEEWLIRLQSQDVCITHVATGLELLCECARDRSTLNHSLVDEVDESLRDPVMFSTAVGKERRHLLVDCGIPLFMRMVNSGSAETRSSIDAEIQESLQYALQQIASEDHFLLALEPLPVVPELEPSMMAASALAALCVGLPVRFQCVTMDSGDRAVSDPGDQEVAATVLTWPDTGQLGRWIAESASRLHRKHLEKHRWSLTDNVRFSGDFLQPSISRNRLRLRIQQLQKATLVCVWLAAASVVVASTHGINGARDRAKLAVEQDRLTQQIEQLEASVNDLHDRPESLVRSMSRIRTHEKSRPMEAVAILTALAGIIDRFPAIELDTLSWSVVADGQSTELSLSALSQVPPREQLWHSDTPEAQLHVQFTGSIKASPDLGLRGKQDVLDDFVGHLRGMNGITEVAVLESPVNGASSSHRLASDGSAYRIALRLEKL